MCGVFVVVVCSLIICLGGVYFIEELQVCVVVVCLFRHVHVEG